MGTKAEPDLGSEGRKGALDRLSDVAAAIEAIQVIIAAAGGAAGWIATHGGLVAILVEIGVFAIACYVACFVTLPAAFWLISLMDRLTNRETSDVAMILVIAISIIGGGLLIRYVVFDPGVTEDLDAIGTAFGASLGVAVLVSPLIILWYRKGSRPRHA